MGWAKDMMMEAEDRGYYLPDQDKFLCSKHYDDLYLKEFINTHSHRGQCSYCGKKTNVINLSEFVEFIMQRIMQHFTTPDNDELYLSSSFYDDKDDVIPGLKRVGCFVTREEAETYDSTKELLYDIDLIADNETLNQDIEDCILNDEWIQRNSMIRTIREELSDLWKDFVSMVTHRRRYTFFTLPQFDVAYFSEENGLQNILSELSRTINVLDLYQILPVNTILFRCRYVDAKDEVIKFDDITSPPDDKASENRMNPSGISMFYGSFDENTVKEEARDSTNKFCVIGEFITKKELTVLDLTNLPPLSFWNDYWQELGFLYSFSKDVSKPIAEKSRSIEYAPTQIFAEYIRYCCLDMRGNRIDGIKFKSSLPRCSGSNIVLFFNQKESKTVLDIKSLKWSDS